MRLAKLAVMITAVAALTRAVVILKAAEVAPAGTVTVAGTMADGELLDNAKAMPPAGAAEPTVTVPEAANPPTNSAGATFSPVRGKGLTVIVAVTTRPDG